MDEEKREKRRQYMREYHQTYKLVHAERMQDPEYRQKRREQRARWKKWVPSGESLERLLAYKKAYYLQNKKKILERQKAQKLNKKAAEKEQVKVESFCVVLE